MLTRGADAGAGTGREASLAPKGAPRAELAPGPTGCARFFLLQRRANSTLRTVPDHYTEVQRKHKTKISTKREGRELAPIFGASRPRHRPEAPRGAQAALLQGGHAAALVSEATPGAALAARRSPAAARLGAQALRLPNAPHTAAPRHEARGGAKGWRKEFCHVGPRGAGRGQGGAPPAATAAAAAPRAVPLAGPAERHTCRDRRRRGEHAAVDVPTVMVMMVMVVSRGGIARAAHANDPSYEPGYLPVSMFEHRSRNAFDRGQQKMFRRPTAWRRRGGARPRAACRCLPSRLRG